MLMARNRSVETPQTTPNHILTTPNHFLNTQYMFLW